MTLEAKVYRGWASAYIYRGTAGAALGAALERLRRQPFSLAAWRIAAKCLWARVIQRKEKNTAAPRSPESLRRHFQIERELANRLRTATPDQRKGLYTQVYSELFQAVPDHPQNTRNVDADSQRQLTNSQWRLLKHFVNADTTYLEVGAGDCHLPIAIADVARHVHAVDVSDLIADTSDRPSNFALTLSDGITIDVPPGTVDVAYSNQLLEHLHPDDAAVQLNEIVKALAPGGTYLMVTPHRYSGPHDISQHFTAQAQGFHLKEYTYREVRKLFHTAGLVQTSVWTGVQGQFFQLPNELVYSLETLLGWMPRVIRRWLARSPILRPIFNNLTVAGTVARATLPVARVRTSIGAADQATAYSMD